MLAAFWTTLIYVMGLHLGCATISMSRSPSRPNLITPLGKVRQTLTGCICSWHLLSERYSMQQKLIIVAAAVSVAISLLCLVGHSSSMAQSTAATVVIAVVVND